MPALTNAFQQPTADSQFGPAPLAPSKYRFLGPLNIKRIDTPASDRGYAEVWPSGEPGSQEYPRPAEIPIDQHGVQVFRPHQFSEDDFAGEALHLDPVAHHFRSLFAQTLSPQQKVELMHQPDYQMGDVDSDERRMQNAVDAAMRGYLVGQWPQEAINQFFTPNQRQLLDQLRGYMLTGKENSLAPGR